MKQHKFFFEISSLNGYVYNIYIIIISESTNSLGSFSKLARSMIITNVLPSTSMPCNVPCFYRIESVSKLIKNNPNVEIKSILYYSFVHHYHSIKWKVVQDREEYVVGVFGNQYLKLFEDLSLVQFFFNTSQLIFQFY